MARSRGLSVPATQTPRWRAELPALDGLAKSQVEPFLISQSGLPGPRANLALADEVAGIGSTDDFRHWAAADNEFVALCGAIGLGESLARGEDTTVELRELALDERWRVREGVARGLQRVGDADLARLASLTARWATDREQLVQRAALAAICEPRFMRDPAAARAAVTACRVVTRSFLARSDRDRVLRQALGYCWSVAIAGAPTEGLDAFRPFRESTDVDAQWIVRENLQKARLTRVL